MDQTQQWKTLILKQATSITQYCPFIHLHVFISINYPKTNIKLIFTLNLQLINQYIVLQINCANKRMFSLKSIVTLITWSGWECRLTFLQPPPLQNQFQAVFSEHHQASQRNARAIFHFLWFILTLWRKINVSLMWFWNVITLSIH